MLEHFHHLRRQWASKAQVLVANLQKITSTDVDRVLGRSRHPVTPTEHINVSTDAFDELLHLSKRISVATSPVQRSYSNEDVSYLGEKSLKTDIMVKEPSTPK